MKICTVALLVAFVVIVLINTTEVWIMAMLTYSIIILVMRRDLDQDHQHNRIKGLMAWIERLRVDKDCLEMTCDRLYEEKTKEIL